MAVWALGEPVLSIVVGGISVIVIVLSKTLMELVYDVEYQRTEFPADIGAASDRLHKTVEEAGRIQDSFNEAVLDRVRAVETSVGQQRGFNEAVLDRVRAVETSVGQQRGFNEAVLNRVRTLESGRPRPEAPQGQPRRIQRAVDMISHARDAIDGWQGPTEVSVPDGDVGPADLGSDTAIPDPDVPLVSVIVTSFNQERFVSEALESIRRQTFENWECIVVDDASIDASVTEIEHFVASDDRFALIRHPENRDVSSARNTGLNVARGRYVTFLDADDLLMQSSLQDRVDALNGVMDPDVAGSFCGMRIGKETVTLSELPDRESLRPGLPFVDFVSSRGECPFGSPCPLLRLDVALAHGGFSEGQSLAADWEFWLRLMRSGFYFVPSRYTSIVYRQVGDSKAQSRAVAHVGEGHALIQAAYRNAAPDASAMKASYPLNLPLPHYEELLVRARRTIQYGAMVLLRGDIESFGSILETLEPGSWPLLERHVHVAAKASDGFRRAAGLDVADLPHLEQDLEPLKAFIVSVVRGVST